MLKPYMEKAFMQKGVTMLASYTYPLQFIWGRKKIETLDDIKGLKLRVAQPEQGEFVRSFGGTSITMSAPEVPSALDRGVVDGIFTAGVGAVLWKDLLKYGYVLIVNVNNSYYIANTEPSTSSRPICRASLRKVAQDAARWDQETMQKEEAESVQDPDRRRIHLHQGDSRRRFRGRLPGMTALLGRMGEGARTRRQSRRWQAVRKRAGAIDPAAIAMVQIEQGERVRSPSARRLPKALSSASASSHASRRWP